MMDLVAVHTKWQERWAQEKLFCADVVSSRPKYFVTFPYPYVNGLPHVGHLFTLMRVEAMARFKRMQGYNVLFPQGWHATGSPIIAAAQLVAQKDEKQIQILRDLGVPEKEIPSFSEPQKWVTYFPPRYKQDFISLGLSIDWRREFITTESAAYRAFIQWQFQTLKKKNYVRKGRFPVVWDPVDNNPVGDHARREGEGETPQEFTLIKHRRADGSYVVTATLRPETILGVTNLFIHPDVTYVLCTVNDEEWIVSSECARKLEFQDKKVTITGEILGRELIGESVFGFSGDKVLILPGTFCDPLRGTGIVHSVPTDSPDDYIALLELQRNPSICAQYGLNHAAVQKIVPLPVLETPGYGSAPAIKICQEMKITSLQQAQKIQEAKEKLYKRSFYESKMNERYTTKYFSKNYVGKSVTEVKDAIKTEIVAAGFGDIFYELTGRVISRGKNECLVKIVTDQWFLAYGDPAWKADAKKCLAQLILYPEKSRQQFLHVIDWLRDWACTREHGLGTPLPWDEKWLIESLSDSTIYMAFYTIAHLLSDTPVQKLDSTFFDWVFLGKGEKPRVKGVDKIRASFLYWYPVDFRNSGKDLIQNHLTFYLFNHVALFSKKHWPKGIGVNGWVTVDGKKMSKSLGNMISVRDMVQLYSADACRLTILNGGEDMDDPNWDSGFAKSLATKFENLFTLVDDYHKKGVRSERAIDKWLYAQVNLIIADTTTCMEKTQFRSAIQRGYFDLQRAYKWYMRRTAGEVYAPVVKFTVETQILLLAPFTSHICEELWSKIGKKTFVSVADWPTASKKIDTAALVGEDYMQQTIEDIRSVITLIKKQPAIVTLFVAPLWKYTFIKKFKKTFATIRDIKTLITSCTIKGHEADVAKLVQQFLKNPAKISSLDLTAEKEFHILSENASFLSSEFGCPIEIIEAEKSSETKAQFALPGKPAILIA